MTPVDVLREIALPALDVLTKPGEVTAVRAGVDDEDFVRVQVMFGPEAFTSYAWQPGVSVDGTWLGKFASELQDFIAESAFAWGTLREYPDEWDG